jgi:hypothetical protein
MSEARLEFGTTTRCRAEPGGEFSRLLVEASSGRCLFAVVWPDDAALAARLVPFERVGVTEAGIVLDCTATELAALPPAVRYEPPPRYSAVETAVGNVIGGPAAPMNQILPAFATDVVPAGSAAIDRQTKVIGADGELGHCAAVVVDLTSAALVALALRHGHLFVHEVTVPAAAISSYGEQEVTCTVAKASLDR